MPTEATEATPGINEDLIRKYHENNDIKSLITIFDYQRRALMRAEELCHAAWQHATSLEKRLTNENNVRSNNVNVRSKKPSKDNEDSDLPEIDFS